MEKDLRDIKTTPGGIKKKGIRVLLLPSGKDLQLGAGGKKKRHLPREDGKWCGSWKLLGMKRHFNS